MNDAAGVDAESSDGALRNRARAMLDKALAVQASAIEQNLRRARQRRPDASPVQVVRVLENMYRATLGVSGAGVGAAAAAPGVGTAAGLLLASGEALSSLEVSTLFVLSVAEVHGVRIDDLERRRTLVLGVILGGSGGETVQKMAEKTGKHWAKKLVAAVPADSIKAVNKVLGRNFVTKYGTKQGVLVLGKVAPFGIGAAIGGAANLATAEVAIRASRRAFGPPPSWWPDITGAQVPEGEAAS